MLLDGLLTGLLVGFCLMLGWFFRIDIARRRRIQIVKDAWALTKLDTPDKVEKIVGKVPKRLQFPEFEEVDWLNIQLAELWPYINKATKSAMEEFVEPLLDQYKPTMVKSMEFKRITLGTRPPEVRGVRVSHLEDGHVVLDANVSWQGSGKIILGIKTNAKLPLQALIRRMSFSGQLRFLVDVTDRLPCIAAVVVAIFRKPTMPHYHLSYELKGSGCNLDSVPGLTNMIHKCITASLEDTLLWPNRLVFPCIADYDTRHLEFMYQGEVVVTLVGAERLKNKDLFDKSDARAVIWVRPTHKASTRVIDNSLHPMWDETFVLPVDDPSTSQLFVEVQDKDAMGWDPLGYASIQLAEVLEAESGREFTVPLAASHSLEENIGEGKLGTITLVALFRQYGEEEREVVTQAERNRGRSKDDPSLSPEAAEAAKARAVQAMQARAGNLHAMRGTADAGGGGEGLVAEQAEAGASGRATNGGHAEGTSGRMMKPANVEGGVVAQPAATADASEQAVSTGALDQSKGYPAAGGAAGPADADVSQTGSTSNTAQAPLPVPASASASPSDVLSEKSLNVGADAPVAHKDGGEKDRKDDAGGGAEAFRESGSSLGEGESDSERGKHGHHRKIRVVRLVKGLGRKLGHALSPHHHHSHSQPHG